MDAFFIAGAYIAVWGCLLVYLVSLWQRTRPPS